MLLLYMKKSLLSLSRINRKSRKQRRPRKSKKSRRPRKSRNYRIRKNSYKGGADAAGTDEGYIIEIKHFAKSIAPAEGHVAGPFTVFKNPPVIPYTFIIECDNNKTFTAIINDLNMEVNAGTRNPYEINGENLYFFKIDEVLDKTIHEYFSIKRKDAEDKDEDVTVTFNTESFNPGSSEIRGINFIIKKK